MESPAVEREYTETDEIRLAQAQRIFQEYNAYKTSFLYEMLPSRKKAVYDLIPLLIHLDAVDLLGAADACQMSPHGVYGYQPAPNLSEAYVEAFPGKSLPQMHSRASFDPTLPIKSICLIGSLGSIAQNAKSDFDYWICFDEAIFSRESYMYFQEKLREIEKWADAFAGAEVHFFPLDLQKVRADDFGVASKESSGSAQGKLLKEEFYRTMTLVAGQAPLWWVMPPGVDDQEYERLAEVVKNSSRVDASTLVDMGNVHEVSLGEFYGAAVWQINKTIGSPFKSVLKMALLEEYMSSRGSRGLLCTELKQRLIKNEAEVSFLDPYILMFQRASVSLAEQGREEDLQLLRQALYMKSGANLALSDYRRTDLPRKKKVMAQLVRKWNWTHKMVERLNNYHYWTFRESQAFSQKTNDFIVRAFKKVSADLSRQKDQVGLTISQRDLTVLGRKLFIYYSKRTNKVDSIRNVIEAPPALEGLTLQADLDAAGKKAWTAYRAMLSRDAVQSGGGAALILKTASDLAEVLIWLVNNQLCDTHTSIILNSGVGPLATHCTVPDLQRLFKVMVDFFPPVKHSEIDEDELLSKPGIVKMLVILNLEEDDRTTSLVRVGICYQNNWAELFFKGYEDPQEGLRIAQKFLRKNFAFDPLGALSSFKVFMPQRHFRKVLIPRLNKYFGLKVVIE